MSPEEFNEPKHLVAHKTNEYPSGLKTAAEIAELVGFVSEQRVTELALSGYLPHYRIDGGPPRFKIAEIKNWVRDNMICKYEGRPFPNAIRIQVPAPPVEDAPPRTIANIPELQQLPRFGYQSGVYFLCKGNDVVYVGQSVSPSNRIATHSAENKKDFDRVYLLPVPQSELDDVEAAFIHHLRPAQQGKAHPLSERLRAPEMSRPESEILGAFLTNGHNA